MIKLSELKKEWIKDPEVRKHYKSLEPEFKIVKFKAIITCHEGTRKTPFYSGYRPGLSFDKNYLKQTSGQITLLDRESLCPGETALVEIIPITLSEEYLGKNFGPGAKFQFYEGSKMIGSGEVQEIEEIKDKFTKV